MLKDKRDVMKKTIKNISFALIMMATVVSSCKKFTDINDDPTQLKDPDANLVLPAVEGRLGFIMGSDVHRFSALFVQQFAAQGGSSVQPYQFDHYAVTESDVNGTWISTFAGCLPDIQKIIAKTDATSPKYSGIAKILKAYTYQTSTDAWGDVPYTEATKYVDNLTPKFDKSSDVYDAILALLDQGIADIKKSSALTPASDDLIYNGDLSKWERFANALKLRIYVHYFSTNATAADIAKGKAGISGLITANTLLRNNADNFQFRFLTAANQTNPIHQFEGSRPNQFFPSKTLVDIMNAKNDDRRIAYFTKLNGIYVGDVNGDPATSTSFSRMNTYLRGKLSSTTYGGEAPIRMLTYAEQNLILAEYYARPDAGNSITTAETFYRAAIQASFDNAREFADATEAPLIIAGATTYLASPNGTILAGNALQKIIEEKFVSNYGVAIEPWTDWRRTSFPALTPVAPATAIPRILPYAFSDRSYNPNTPARPSIFTKSVFWDK